MLSKLSPVLDTYRDLLNSDRDLLVPIIGSISEVSQACVSKRLTRDEARPEHKSERKLLGTDIRYGIFCLESSGLTCLRIFECCQGSRRARCCERDDRILLEYYDKLISAS